MALAITSRIVSGLVIMDLSGRLCFLEVSLHEHVTTNCCRKCPVFDVDGLPRLVQIQGGRFPP